jgi:hypothetical protein
MEEVKIKDRVWRKLKWRTRGGRKLNGGNEYGGS